ncbi:hypothetical protein BD560DRAFT_414305 [Blakeslea trispora]|nr:hypothetical protein BD560DRAFT_414305 [Blakeslea trispora]
MTNDVCVDYLSHEWSCKDLIKMHQELRKQRSKILFDLTVNDLSIKEQKRLKTERHRQIRYENTIWRSMSRKCTAKLGALNNLIHPSEINWQKESDSTWLYGPLSVSPDHPITIPTTHIPKQSDLKSALKQYHGPYLDRYRYARHWSKVASESGKQHYVRFDPDIIELSYFSEQPTREISKCLKLALVKEEEEEEEEFWELMVKVGIYLKSRLSADYSTYAGITQLCISVTTLVCTAFLSFVIGDRKTRQALKQAL